MLDEIAAAIHREHAWVRTDRVVEVYQGGEILWQGDVHVLGVDLVDIEHIYACVDDDPNAMPPRWCQVRAA